jgi:hypothetical protein
MMGELGLNKKVPAQVTIPGPERFAGICRKWIAADLTGFHNPA